MQGKHPAAGLVDRVQGRGSPGSNGPATRSAEEQTAGRGRKIERLSQDSETRGLKPLRAALQRVPARARSPRPPPFRTKIDADLAGFLPLQRLADEAAGEGRLLARLVCRAQEGAVLAHAEPASAAPAHQILQHPVQTRRQITPLLLGEPCERANQSLERVLPQQALPFAGQIQDHAAPVSVRLRAGQQTTANETLDRLRRGAPGGEVKVGECRNGAGKPIGASEIAKGRPLSCRQAPGTLAPYRPAEVDNHLGDCPPLGVPFLAP